MERLTNSQLGDILSTIQYTSVSKQEYRRMRDSLQGSSTIEEIYARLSMIEDILGDEYTTYQLLSMKANYERLKEYTKNCDTDEVVMISANKLQTILRDRLATCLLDDSYGSLAGAVSGAVKLVDSAPKLTLAVPRNQT